MAFLHMHHAMANKALMQAKYTEGLADQTTKLMARVREIILSGAADYKDRWQPTPVTDEDRALVLRYLGA
ncbi:MAG: hypothetical protein PGN22_03075 [Agrobacterium cavarae]